MPAAARQGGYDVRSIQKLRGAPGRKATMTYTHILNRGGPGVRSPADMLWAGVAGAPAVRQLSMQPNFYDSAVPLELRLTAG
jgi:hypothetical protein